MQQTVALKECNYLMAYKLLYNLKHKVRLDTAGFALSRNPLTSGTGQSVITRVQGYYNALVTWPELRSGFYMP